MQWQVSTDGGATFTNLSNGGVYSNVTTPILSISSTTGLSGNLYQAVYTNSVGSTATSAATLTAGTAPAVTIPPTNQTANAGTTVTFTAAASGTPTPTVQWQVSTNGGTSFTAISGATSTTLTLTNVTSTQNNNQFEAVFTNVFGSATTSAATLTVHFAPTVTTNPTSNTSAGSTATFTRGSQRQSVPNRAVAGELQRRGYLHKSVQLRAVQRRDNDDAVNQQHDRPERRSLSGSVHQ